MSSLMAALARQRWWLGRVAVLPIHVFVFAIAAFFLVRIIPGDPARTLAGPDATAESYQQIKEQLGLSGSLASQFGDYVSGLLHLDLGRSILSGRPVLSEVLDRLPGTVELALMAFTALVTVSLLLSLVVLLRPRSIAGRLVNGYSQIAGALPDFVVGVCAIFLFYATLHLVPAPNGRLRPGIQQPESVTGLPFLDCILRGDWTAASSMAPRLMLPVTVLVISTTPLLLKQLLSAIEHARNEPPTLFRVAAGAPLRIVVLSVYRRALPPTVALMGTVFGTLLGGAVILESLFALGGLGTYAVQSVNGTDLTALQGVLVVVAAISMLVFLAVDLVNMWLDPRRKPGVQGVDT